LVHRPGAAGKPDYRETRKATLDQGYNSLRRLDNPARETRFRQYPGPTVEQLYGIDTGFDLPAQKFCGRLLDYRDQRLEADRISVGPGLDVAEILARSALDHIGRNGPRRPGKPDQCGLIRQM